MAEGKMRGADKRSGELFSYVDLEKRCGATIKMRVERQSG